MLRKALLALALTSVSFVASAATVNVVNKVVSIQFANGTVFVKDYTPNCSTSIGIESFSTNGVESVNVNCVTFSRIQTPPFFVINKRLIETIRDR